MSRSRRRLAGAGALAAILLCAPAGWGQSLQGNPVRGRQVFAACRTCHYPERGYGNHNGPSLYGIFGRTAGTQPGFAYYSRWLKAAGFQWTPETLDAWLANPDMFPESVMVFVAIPDAQARADLIAYLAQFHH